MFSFSLFLQNGTSPGILDKDDKLFSLLACFFMLHFCLPKPFPPHSWEPWETPEPLLMHPTLGNHEKHPKPFSCFIFGLPNHSHNTLGNPEKHPPPFSCFILNNYSWEPWETPQPLFMLHFLHSETLPTPLLGAIKHPNPFSCFILAFPSPSHPTLENHEARNPVFMLHSWPSQTLPTPRLGTMKHPNPFSCFILRLPKTFREAWTSFWCFRLFPPHSWEPSQRSLSSTSGISNSRSFHPSHPTLGNHEPTTLFGTILHLPKPFPPHSWEPWSTQIPFHASFWPSRTLPTPRLGTMRNTQTPFHASFLTLPNRSHRTLGNHEKHPDPLFMLHF